ncbi:MAG: hypothetical protein ABI718_17335, partial [Acidobacteriota bacterium]
REGTVATVARVIRETARRVTTSIKETVGGKSGKSGSKKVRAASAKPASSPAGPKTGKTTRVQRASDIDPADLADATPSQQSAKGSMDERGSWSAREEDVVAESGAKFADEDHFTNHTGDPRIGTHGRKYEP